MRIAFIGDPHCHPGYDNQRFLWLGRWLVERRPDVVVCAGDFADMASLSSYDKGKGTAEGRRVKRDLDHCRDALRLMHGPIESYNGKRRAAKKGPYSPRFVITLGNHEYRLKRAENDNPELEGLLGYDALPFSDFGWEVYPYHTPVVIGGFTFLHEHSSARGKYPAASLASGAKTSTCQGHIHKADVHTTERLGHGRIRTVVAGSYAHPDYREDWCAAHRHTWTEGVFELDDVEDGDYGAITWVSQERLARRYG